MMKKIHALFLACGILLALALPAQAAIVSMDYGDEGYFPELEESTFIGWDGSTEYYVTGSFELALPCVDDASLRLNFSYTQASYTTTEVRAYGVQTAAEVKAGPMVLKLEKDIEIGPDSSWLSTYQGPTLGGYLYNWYSQVDGNWEDMDADETAFLGFTFTNTDNVACYGWMELSIDRDCGYVSIYEWAYDDAGNTILTGQTGTDAVPVPAAAWLLGSGLLGLVGLKRRGLKA
jgi:hypothetical protein